MFNLDPEDLIWSYFWIICRLRGNPVCSNNNLSNVCGPKNSEESILLGSPYSPTECQPQSCPFPYEYSPKSPVPCFCAAPLLVGYRLKSPGFSYFRRYKSTFENYISDGLSLNLSQLEIDSYNWEAGPRLKMYLKLFPIYEVGNRSTHLFNDSEVRRIRWMFTGWRIQDSDLFGPFEVLNFTLLEPYQHGLFHIPFSYILFYVKLRIEEHMLVLSVLIEERLLS